MADTTADLDSPVYEEPEDVEYETVDLGEQKDVDEYIDEDTMTVSGQVANILSEGSPILTSAEADAATTSNSRGILNSTMGVSAGTAAVIDAATEIASQDASIYASLAATQQETDSAALLANQEAEISRNESLTNAKISGALTEQETEASYELQELVNTAAEQQLEIEYQWQQSLQDDQLDAADAQALVETTASLSSTLTGSIERIMRDTNVTDKEAAVEALMTQYESSLTTAAALLNIELDWS